MTDQEHRPSQALTAPRHPWRTTAIASASVLALASLTLGGFALANTLNQPEPAATVAAEPTSSGEPNLEPSATISATIADLTVSVDASGSEDPDGAILGYAWDFGDDATDNKAVTSHTYAAAGTYTVTLTIVDNDDAEASITYSATVTAPPPAPSPVRCPAGSTANSSDGYNDTSCFPDVCFTIAVPDPAHPECDVAFRP